MSRPTTWTPEQLALLRDLAGRRSTAVIARRLRAIGPSHSIASIIKVASQRRISLRRPHRPPHGGTPWQDGENAMLLAMAGQHAVEAIAEAINARFGMDRSPAATQRQANHLGIALARYGGTGMVGLRRALSIDPDRIRREVAAGRLRAELCGDGRQGADWLFLDADVETWIKAHPYALDWRRVRRPRWRDLARAAYLRDPHLSIAATASHLDINQKTLAKWVQVGKVADLVNIGTARKPVWRIPLRALDRIEQLARKGAA